MFVTPEAQAHRACLNQRREEETQEPLLNPPPPRPTVLHRVKSSSRPLGGQGESADTKHPEKQERHWGWCRSTEENPPALQSSRKHKQSSTQPLQEVEVCGELWKQNTNPACLQIRLNNPPNTNGLTGPFLGLNNMCLSLYSLVPLSV